MTGTLYLLPCSLGESDHRQFLPPDVARIIPSLTYYIVENLRTARRYLKSIDRDTNIDACTFFELNKHTSPDEVPLFIEPLLNGSDTGLITEAGLPGIADPGASVIRLAHQGNIRVKPLTGPSSLFLALMASGLNGQAFRFSGYLPVNRNERIEAIRRLEEKALHDDESQLFIETPYRNNALLNDLLARCRPDTLLTIAVDLTLEN